MMKQLLNIILGKAKTKPKPPKDTYTDPKIVPFEDGSLVTLNMEDWSTEDRHTFQNEAAKISNINSYSDHIENGYALSCVATSAQCPLCKAETRQQYANFIYATQIATRVMFAPAGYFCTNCPTVIIDEKMIQSGMIGNFVFQGVLGIDYNEEKKPDMFKTWNGQTAVYLIDENEMSVGIATIPVSQPSHPSQPPRYSKKKKDKNSARKHMAKASRRHNQRQK